VWRRFDQCNQLPVGYLPIGDYINSLNPIFGQGMTVTIGHTMSLIETIKEMGLDSSKAFQNAYLARAMKWTDTAWKKTQAFDKNFIADQVINNNRIELVRKFTAMQHKKITESKDFHLKLLRESQFLNHH
jgi:2-polyprenyl-6-methoxyphenol hydroxylase-like FAD-dependent oxidoreductase